MGKLKGVCSYSLEIADHRTTSFDLNLAKQSTEHPRTMPDSTVQLLLGSTLHGSWAAQPSHPSPIVLSVLHLTKMPMK